MKTVSLLSTCLTFFRNASMALLLVHSAGTVAQEYTVNLKDTDIQEFIKFVADVTGTTMVVDPNVKGLSLIHI